MQGDGEDTREFDLVLFGATGFTGGMTAAYLAEHAPAHLRWALAGRARAKLEAVKQRLLAQHPGCGAMGLIEADVSDPDSLSKMAARTRVVLTTVGPFVEYGEPLVQACIAAGTDYIDSCGEREFVRQIVRRQHATAQARGVRVVSCCGFDAIPADLGVYYTIKQLPGDRPIDIQGYMAFLGVFSGGTERSAIKSLSGPKLPDSEYTLSSGGRRLRILKARIRRVASLPGWVTPMDTVDPLLVLRSAKSHDSYGPVFSYTHHMVHKSLFAALFVLGFIAWLALMSRIAPLQAMVLKGIKPSGEGPTEAQMDAGYFRLVLQATCDGQSLETEVSGGDPGYRETSMMLAQSALCLLEDRAQLPARAGMLTPVEAMGDALLSRLQAAGMTFRVRGQGDA